MKKNSNAFYEIFAVLCDKLGCEKSVGDFYKSDLIDVQ
jgi:hypothetical protein